ncbi:LPD38 domain-containing protein [Paraburkholderia silviterrae]|uniref:Large polyvalent protein associated domain-containing protein n=1 Tax=Paraburkholderia silviterrae TaxID=2528715 RepID=A0A4R5MET9_9BURK|nr:LPD38 domain-containing protein [Paraburkholderia silviterrae]TDG25127.1 hypothetical protein EYW47_04495 [Paraburkholderia silviterrae]
MVDNTQPTAPKTSQPTAQQPGANPYAQIEAQQAAGNPYAQLEGPDPGALSDAAHGVAHGESSIVPTLEQGGQFIGHAVHALGAVVDSNTIEDLGSNLVQRMSEEIQAQQSQQGPGTQQSAQGQEGGVVRRNMYGMGEMIGQTGSLALGGATLGAALGSILPGPGTVAGAGIGLSIGLLGQLGLMIGQFAESSFERVQAASTKAGMPAQQAENRALGAGTITGTIAGAAQYAFNRIGLGNALEPLVNRLASAAEGQLVKTAFTQTLGNVAKGSAAAAAEGAAVNTATQAGVQGTEAAYGAGDGPTASGLIDAAVQGAAFGGVMHAAGATVQGVRAGGTAKLLADPQADPDARANAALGAAALIATKSPDVANDFGLYAQNQILKGQPIEIGPDAMYTGFADAIRQQQSDADAQAQQRARGTIGQAFPNFTPTGDEAAGAAPSALFDPNAPDNTNPGLPSWATAAPRQTDEQAAAADIGNVENSPSWLKAAGAPIPSSPVVPEVAPPSITDTIGTIMHAGSVDDAIAAAEQVVGKSAAEGVMQARGILSSAGVPTPAEAEATPAPDALTAERAFYADQANQAQQAMRTQAFDQTQATNAPLAAPADAFAQRQTQLAAQDQQARERGFAAAEQAQREQQAAQAPAVTEAQGFNEPAAPSPLSTAMSAELTRLGNRDLNNLTTTQLGALAAHHPDPAIREQAQQIAAGRRNAQLVAEVTKNPERVSTVSANGDMLHGVAAPQEPEFSQQRAGILQDAAHLEQPDVTERPAEVVTTMPPAHSGLQGAETTDTQAEATGTAPATAPARSLADTAPELQPLKAAMDSDARARGQADSGTGLVPVDPTSLPDVRTPASNGVEGATTLSRDDVGLLQKSAAIFGKRVVLFRQEGDTAGRSLDGAVLPGDSKAIYVNADASGAHHLVVVGHELAHQMQAEAPNLYKGMQDALMAHVGEGGENRFYRYYMNRGDMSDEQVRQATADPGVRQRMTDEFIADLVGNRFGEYRTWQQVFADAAGPKANRSLVYRIADFVTSFIDKLLTNVGFKKFATDDMVNNLQGVRTQVRRALSEYATQAGSRPMQHEADMLRAKVANRNEGTQPTQLVEPVRNDRAFVGKVPDRSSPAPVQDRSPEPTQGTAPVRKFGQPVARFGDRRAVESPAREPEPTQDAAAARMFRQPVARFNDERALETQEPAQAAADRDKLSPDQPEARNADTKASTPVASDTDATRDAGNGPPADEAGRHPGGSENPGSGDRGPESEISGHYRRGTGGGRGVVEAENAEPEESGPDAAKANPLSGDPQVRASGERALYLGNLDAAQEAAARSVGAITQKQTYKERIDALKKDLGAKLTQGIADQFYPIKQLDANAYMHTRLAKGAETGGLEAMLLYGKPVLRDGVLDVDVHDTGFAKVLSGLDGEQGRFFLWVAAQRAEQLMAQGKENLFTDSDISALKTLDRSDAEHPQRQQKFAAALSDYNDFNDAVLKVAEDSGLLDASTRQLFKDQPYVPFYRAMDEGEGMRGPGKTGGLVNQYAFKKLKGGTGQLNQDLLANTLSNWGHLLGAAAKNRAAQLTMDAATRVGAADRVTAADAGKGAVKVLVDGKPEFYEVSDPHLLSAVSAMSAQVPGWMRPLATFKQILTTGTTLAPGFRIRNLIRDTLTALGTTDIKLNPVSNVVQGYRGATRGTQTHASMLASGGIINFGTMLEGNEATRAHRLIEQGVDAATILNNEGAVSAMWTKAQHLAELYHEFGNKVENANRAALYEQLTAQGMGHDEASFHARDLMDFSLQGQFPVVRFLTTAVPFLNARIQGAYKLGRAVAENPRRAGTVMGAVAMASLGLMLAYRNDPDWQARPDWDRDNYWWFKIGDTAYRIPKPFEVGAVGTLAERTWEALTDPEMTNSRYIGELRSLLVNQFNLNPVPQIVRPLYQVYANKDDFTGRAIESQSLQSMQPEDRYTPYTSMAARFLGQLGLPDPVRLMQGEYSKLSPVQIDYLVNGYFGWLGTTATAAVDVATRPFSDNGPKPALQLRDYTMGFASSLPENASRYADVMSNNLTAIQQAYASYHASLNTGQFDKAQDVLNREHMLGPDNRTLIFEHEMAQNAATIESRLALQEKRILDSPTLSADTKRAMLNRIDQQRNELAQRISGAELKRQDNE